MPGIIPDSEAGRKNMILVQRTKALVSNLLHALAWDGWGTFTDDFCKTLSFGTRDTKAFLAEEIECYLVIS